MGKFVKAVIGIGMIVAGVLTANPFLIAQGIAVTAGALLAPSSKQQARQASETSIRFGEQPRQAIFGETATAGGLVDAFNYGGKYGTDWELLVIAIADHECAALSGFYVDDQYVPYTSGGGPVPGYKGKLYVDWYPGTETQVPVGALAMNGWPLADNMAGVAFAVVLYRADGEKEKHPVWPGGRPRFLFVVKGAKLYDPRKDSTVPGGSGPHRWNDPSTREWSDNPIVARYNWARGLFACNRVDQPDQLMIGRGLSAMEAPHENVAWRANICDELVALKSGGSEKRYRFNGVIKADEEFQSVEENFAAACGGVIVQPGGAVEIEPGHARTPTFVITDDDLIVGSNATWTDFRSEADGEWVNTVHVRYVEPSQKWADHETAIRRVAADVIADGRPREDTVTLTGVTSGTQAQRCGEIRRRFGRLLRTGTLTVGPRFCAIEEGDWGIVQSARRTGGEPVLVRVESYEMGADWQMKLSLREVSAAIYDWDPAVDELADGAEATQQTPPAYDEAPDADDWTVVGVTLQGPGGATAAIRLTGAAPSESIAGIVVETRVTGAAGWTVDTILPGSATERLIQGLRPGIGYEVALSYQIGGETSERLILGPVTAGDVAVRRGAHQIVSQSIAYPVTSTDTTISIAKFSGTLDDGRKIEFPAGSVTGLTAGKEYVVLWDLVAAAYAAIAAPALDAMADQKYAFIRRYSTSTGGAYDPGTPPPGGDGGTGPGGNCVTTDTLILMADGEWRAAGDIRPSDWVRTQHEGSLQWGEYRVTAASFATEPVFAAPGLPRATGDHRFWIDGGWRRMRSIGEPDGEAMVARLTVDQAHTYISRHPAGRRQVLSHNLKPISD